MPQIRCAVFTKDDTKSKFRFVDQTETHRPSRKPEFDDLITLETVFSTSQVRVMLYDLDSVTQQPGASHVLGSASCSLREIKAAGSKGVTLQVAHKGKPLEFESKACTCNIILTEDGESGSD
jgi:hypothetical protein